ncbi:hypothetical protein Pla52o_23830 [Novipirellula galeiformis]|uniref:RHS Repeat protein n=1 Tax=Novipirellula galeiformis TaxID=2528004 RepID=A0A5C6CK28_9BACT|nr:hypothetical protein Pla52o_23830 [Novipirellula galeiformis]
MAHSISDAFQHLRCGGISNHALCRNPAGIAGKPDRRPIVNARYVYDDFGRLFRTIYPDYLPSTIPRDPNTGITQGEYDSLNRLLRTTDQLGGHRFTSYYT